MVDCMCLGIFGIFMLLFIFIFFMDGGRKETVVIHNHHKHGEKEQSHNKIVTKTTTNDPGIISMIFSSIWFYIKLLLFLGIIGILLSMFSKI